MSRTTASALNNRIVTFVDIDDDDFNCALCMQVADEPVRCSGMCAGIFCNGCLGKALKGNKTCPSCNKARTSAMKDVVLRNQIMKHQVYCLNKHTDRALGASLNEEKSAPNSNNKCLWTGSMRQ